MLKVFLLHLYDISRLNIYTFLVKGNIINLQYSLSDLLGGSCVSNAAAQVSNEERRPLSRASYRR